MKETFYFPHDYHARHDPELNNLFLDHGIEAIGAYWCIVEMLYEENGVLPTNYERITKSLRTNKELVESIITNYELFKTDGVNFWSDSVNRRLEERRIKSESARTSVSKRWNRDTNVLQSHYVGNTIKESKVKESKVNNSCIFTPPTIEQVRLYCQERKNSVNAIKFVSHYETTGWIRGKNKIKDWKACVRTWEINDNNTELPKIMEGF